MSTRTAGRSLTLAGSTLALEGTVVALMAATAFGFLRVFDGASVLRPLLAAVVVSEAIAMAGRRLRLPTLVTAIVSAATLVVVLANRAAPATTSRFLPTRDTWPALGDVVAAAVESFGELRAPVPPVEPLVLAAFVGLWVATFVTDWGVVRLRLGIEPLLPPGGLFLLCAVLGSGQHRISSTVVFAAAIAVHAVVHRIVNQAQRVTWLAVERSRGIRALALGGMGLGAVSLVAGSALGSHLPGAGSDELWTWRGGGDSTRVVVSPFVTIESRLADQADQELFRVTADEPAYWRTAGLDVYQDGVWQIRGDFSRQSGRLPGDRPAAGTVSLVRQTYSLTGLAEIWLPAAYAPARIVDSDGPVTWNEATSTLSVDRDRSESSGAVYTVESALPRYTVEELQAASENVPDGMAEDFLALPGDVSPRAIELARLVTAGQPTRYDQLRALQDWFLTEFRYDTALGPREGDPIEQFLAERAGFCQQFAGTFAVMARALGAPARVAVGFTWGEPDPDDPTSYVVTGRHAHAWPEVWFEGLGWVPFEPTPGRGAPGAEAWTGIPAQQDGAAAPDAAPADAPDPVEPAPVPLPPLDGDIPPELLADLLTGEAGGGAVAEEDGGFLDRPPTAVVGLAGLAASWLIGVPLVDAALRMRRRSRSHTPADRVSLLWRTAIDELDLLGYRRDPAETRAEFVERVGHDRRFDRAGAPLRLAELATTARFHPPAVGPEAVSEAEDDLRRLQAIVHRRISRRRRYLRQIDPRRRLRRS